MPVAVSTFMPDTPEQLARQKIDTQLAACGWFVQDYKAVDFSAGRGIALREVPLKTGPCDYLLLVDRKPVGVIEAKRTGTRLSIVAEQSRRYAGSKPEFLAGEGTGPLPYQYETTGVETNYRNESDPHPRSRPVFTFHRPETLADLSNEPDTLRHRLVQMPFAHPLIPPGAEGALAGAASHMRDCQIEAITNLEKSFAENRPRALIQMATGAGKTFTACAFTYRLIKYAGARRVLFLVDRSNLGRQARAEFLQYVTPDTGRKFTELYNVQHLTSNALDPVCRVTICTIQRLYSMLRGEELPEDADELSTYEISAADGRPKEVAYNPAIPIETFDFVVTDECHRSIYGLWRQVLEYFDAFIIGLTATPSKQTIGFFNQNLVMEYNHERAVADGVNVGYEVYRIKTQVTEQGGKVEKGFYVDKRNKLDRSKRWEQLDEDLAYAAPELDRSVVVPSQIRTVLSALKDALFTELFPGRTLVPKTLIFTKDDSHAEDVVHLCREVFGRGNDFCKKITYQAKHPTTGKPAKTEDLIQEFRTSPQLRIAVTVDMIATGTDIKPLECLLFLRDVRSRVYFEQMKGRGTRVLTPTDLQAVSGADARVKTHFVIVDAVGVCESDKTDSRPLEKQPTVKFDKLLLGVALGKRDEDTLTTLAGRLARLDRELDPAQRSQVTQLSGGQTVAQMSAALLRAIDPDSVEAASRRLSVEQDAVWAAEKAVFFDPNAPLEKTLANLPHWKQDSVIYFVTFRLVDSLPQEKLRQWLAERDQWLALHPEPRTEADQTEYHSRFSGALEDWLDQGSGSCVLDLAECKELVTSALRHFDGQRYALGEFVVASNHVHVLMRPLPGHDISDILHSWKSFTAKQIIQIDAASRRLEPWWDKLHERRSADAAKKDRSQYLSAIIQRPVWQKESFDHIVRSPASLQKFEEYIRNHSEWENKRRDAASTLLEAAKKQLILEACAPFDKPAVREILVKLKQQNEQTIDTVTADVVLQQGFDGAAREKAANLLKSFREYIEQHKAEITALQILYSRPYRQRLTESMLKELEEKLKQPFGSDPVNTLWHACELTGRDVAPRRPEPPSPPLGATLSNQIGEGLGVRTGERAGGEVGNMPGSEPPSPLPAGGERGRGRGEGVRKSAVHRFADLVVLVRYALERQPILAPFAESVCERFNEWLADKQAGNQSGSGVPPLGSENKLSRPGSGTVFSSEQLAWLNLIRDHIATSLSIEPEDLELSPFNQRGGLGKAHQLFGEQLPKLLDELNEILAA